MASSCGEVLGDACPLSRKCTLVRWPDTEVVGVFGINAFQVVQEFPKRPVCWLNEDSVVVDGAPFWFKGAFEGALESAIVDEYGRYVQEDVGVRAAVLTDLSGPDHR